MSDKDLQLYQERNSLGWKDTRPLVETIWATAARLGVREFIARPKHDVQDDHVMLHNIGKIPCIDLIDFDYPPLAHSSRHARAMFGPKPGQSRLGDKRMVEDREVSR